MDTKARSAVVTVNSIEWKQALTPHQVALPAYDRERHEDVAFLTAMTLVLLGNYAQTGHFGGPLAYTPYNVAVHLLGPEAGGLRYDIRQPKHPFADRFMLAGGHSIPTCYALWMILYEAMRRQHEATGDAAFAVDPRVAILPIDALGFRRGRGALATLLEENGLSGHALFRQAKGRGIRSLAGHAETTDATNDVNGGPSGIGIATAAGKALFWDTVAAPPSLKIIAFEGEFALATGHAQEMKTAALAQRVGKRLRVLLSFNNAGIDAALLGDVIKPEHRGYDIAQQWASYGWNVLAIENGNRFDDVCGALKAMEEWPADDRRPMIVIGPTVKGWWPGAVEGRIPGYDGPMLVGYPSHPYGLKMNSEYFVALAETFERRYGVEFAGIRDGVPKAQPDRLVQFMTNIEVAMSVMERVPGLREWIATRLVDIAGTLDRKLRVNVDPHRNPYLDPRFEVANLPREVFEARLRNRVSGEDVTRTITLFEKPGKKLGARRAISEIVKWMNYASGGRFFTVAADLSDSINVEKGHFFGHYDPVANPAGTRLEAAIQEAVNASTIIGLVGQSLSDDPGVHVGAWGLSGTYGAFTPLMYTPARVFSQQNQDSPFALGVLTILAGHSGPETAADARTHFGIFAPQVWTLMPRGQVINLYLWDYNDVAPGYFAAVSHAARKREVGIIVIHVARPDAVVADRSGFADPDPAAAAKGVYLVRDHAPDRPPMGTVLAQGSSSTVNLVAVLPRLEKEGINVRVASVVSPELFAWQDAAYRERVFPEEAAFDCMVVSTMTKRVPPLPNLGPLTEEYSLYADWDDRWRTGGTEADVIAEAHLDPESVFAGVVRFARDREARLRRQRRLLDALGSSPTA